MSFNVRAAAERVVDYYVPSEYPEERFLDLIDNHWEPGGGTTCAYLTAKILVLLGCREPDFVNHDDPEGLGRQQFAQIAAYEREFGKTINRNRKTVVELANEGTPYEMEPADVRAALSHTFDEPIILPAGAWRLPRGAYGDSTGPT